MALSTLVVTAPHATAYDAAFPTRSTENYAHGLHEILQDMEDAGPWYLTDLTVSTTVRDNVLKNITDNCGVVFDYAAEAIEEHRADTPITILKPLWNDLSVPVSPIYKKTYELQIKNYIDCMQMMFKIYYMWKTEEDPLLLKEKLQELLLAWPLTDTEIILNEEGGQSLHVVPAWKNVDV